MLYDCILGDSAPLAINVARKKLNLDTFLRLILNFQVISSIPHFFLSIFILVNFEIWIWRENNFKNDWCAMKYFKKFLLLTRGCAGLPLAFHPDDPSSNLGQAINQIFFLSKTNFFLLKLHMIIIFAYFMAIEHKNFVKVENSSDLAVWSSFHKISQEKMKTGQIWLPFSNVAQICINNVQLSCHHD